jgi:hypothetical protein
MPTILYPQVPNFPGVPQLLRPLGFNLSLTSTSSVNFPALNYQDIQPDAPLTVQPTGDPVWGIFGPLPDSSTQLGISSGSTVTTTVLSTFSVEWRRETKVSDFPLQNGSFATYNRVQMPSTPKVVLALDGSENDRATFLVALEAACLSTNLYVVSTPEYTFYGYALESYSYSRKASRGVTLLTVEVQLKEVRQVSPNYGTVATPSPIVSPQNPASIPPVNGGMQQPATPSPSLLRQANTGIQNFIGPPTF